MGFLARDFSYEFRYLTGFFLLAFVIATIFFVGGLYFLIRSYWNHEYHYIPKPGVLHAYLLDLRAYYTDIGEDASVADPEFDEFLSRKLLCSGRNVCRRLRSRISAESRNG
ncbi:MAG: hypothetical protein WD690_17810 [Vicinamibacterales bacterium]